ncbi:TetR/AcrR family transcriptional regulator [Rhodococcus sp. OK302]|uniref:TetR/AcrR family transcriptional regulator n=1 Tax=Rhodococcus sp. OK302 TaxID=1882769 RepID=UPI000B94414E|nr:TetR/AcrR family transcriptional regulator [Rhodococcus sp. OK302]OYD67506.1 TetR family transcriptional regulator [Rhodococcus sp. OK302]
MTNTAESAQPDGRSTRWNDHKEQRRARILDAALDAVNEGGADIGVQLIAERADVPRSVVYRIFKDRADLDEQLRVRILDMMMSDLTPTLTPAGTVGDTISRAVHTYIQWIMKYPRLHHFLGKGSPSTRTTGSKVVGSKVVTGTKTAIAVQLGNLLGAILASRGKPSKMAEPLAFGLIGLVDVSVNRWLSQPGSDVSSTELADFLELSIWQVLDGNLRRMGIDITLKTPISEL